jgi:hypothetical protein
MIGKETHGDLLSLVEIGNYYWGHKYAYIVIPACPESFLFFQKDSRRALLAGMTGIALLMVFLVTITAAAIS